MQSSPPKSPQSQVSESSVLFSLHELMSLERERIAAEEEQARREAERLLEARREKQQRERELENERLACEAAERHRLLLEQREEDARLAGIFEAQVVAARTAEESRAKFELLALAQKHEAELTELQVHASRTRLKRLLFACGVLLLGLCVFTFMTLRASQLEASRIRAQATRDTEALRGDAASRAKALELRILELTRKSQHLPALEGTPTHEQASKGTNGQVAVPSEVRPNKPKPPPTEKPQQKCEEGDPVCFGLGG